MKRTTGKRILAAVTAMGLLLSLSSCSAWVTQAEEKEEEKLVLNVWHLWTNDTNELKKNFDESVEDYLKTHPNVEIRTQTLDTEAYKRKIAAEFVGDASGIDVFYYWGAGTAQKLVNADRLLPLEDYLTEEVKSRILEGSTTAFEYDGVLYSLPSFSWYLTLFCNRDLFEQAGAKLPETYEELVDAVERLKQLEGVTPIASGAKEAWNAALIYQAFALREVGGDQVNAMLRGETGFTDEGYRAAAEKVVELNAMGAFGEDPLEQGNDEANSAFGTGTAAMRLMGSWLANGLYTDGNTTIELEDIVAIQFPMIQGKGEETDYCGGFVESFWVNKNTPYPEEAAEFAIYINERTGIAAYETGAGFSGWKGDMKESGLNPLFVQIRELQDKGRTGVLAWDTSLQAEPAAIHNAQVQNLFLPDADVDGFMEAHRSAIEN